MSTRIQPIEKLTFDQRKMQIHVFNENNGIYQTSTDAALRVGGGGSLVIRGKGESRLCG